MLSSHSERLLREVISSASLEVCEPVGRGRGGGYLCWTRGRWFPGSQVEGRGKDKQTPSQEQKWGQNQLTLTSKSLPAFQLFHDLYERSP